MKLYAKMWVFIFIQQSLNRLFIDRDLIVVGNSNCYSNTLYASDTEDLIIAI